MSSPYPEANISLSNVGAGGSGNISLSNGGAGGSGNISLSNVGAGGSVNSFYFLLACLLR